MTAHLDDTVSERGFTFAPKRAGVPYGGYVQVYESSAANRPYVWVRAVEAKVTGESDAAVHLTLEDALKFAGDILRTCNNHYQTRESDDD